MSRLGGEIMRRKILLGLAAIILTFSGCSGTKTKEPVSDETLNKSTVKVELYYIEESTGEITSKVVTLEKEVLAEEIVKQLKKEKVLSEDCDVQDMLVSEDNTKIELDFNNAFGEYIRNMGTNGSESILECVVKSYLGAYECEELKITEDGAPLDTGHAVLDGYISY